MSCKKKSIWEFLFCMMISVLLFAVIYKCMPIIFSTNDDRMIMEIVSGKFSGKPESYGIQMTFGLTWLMSRLYAIAGNLQWYVIILMSAQIFSFGTILYRLQSFQKNTVRKIEVIALAILVYLVLWSDVFTAMTYTSTAGFVGLAALFWYGSSKTNWKNLLMTAFLANLSFSIRPNIFYMLLPLAGIIYLWKIIWKEKKRKLTIWAPFLMLSITAVLFMTDACAYSVDGWKEFRTFFDQRTTIYDYYHYLPYTENKELYDSCGITEEEFYMLKIYDYTLLGDLPKEFFPKYIDAYQKYEKEQGITFFTKALDGVKDFSKNVFSNGYGTANTILFIVSIVLLVYLFIKKEWALFIYLAVQYLSVIVLWQYFTYWGRAIGRIQVTMSLLLLSVILNVCMELHPIKLPELKWQCIGKTMIFAVLLIFAAKTMKGTYYYNIQKVYEFQDIEEIRRFCSENPDNLYFMDIMTMVGLDGQATIQNEGVEKISYHLLGDWLAYCPLYDKKLRDAGIDNVKEAVCSENAYTIILNAYQLQRFEEYMGNDYVTEWTKSISGANERLYPVYRNLAVQNTENKE